MEWLREADRRCSAPRGRGSSDKGDRGTLGQGRWMSVGKNQCIHCSADLTQYWSCWSPWPELPQCRLQWVPCKYYPVWVAPSGVGQRGGPGPPIWTTGKGTAILTFLTSRILLSMWITLSAVVLELRTVLTKAAPWLTPILPCQVFWAIGTVFEVVLAVFVMPSLGWRWLLILSAVPLLLFAVLCFVGIL